MASPSAAPSRIVTYLEAAEIVRQRATALAPPALVETLSLIDALARVLAVPVLADRDQPPFPRSTRDGFACRAADLARGDALRVIGQVRASEVWPADRTLLEGEAIEIMTGAPVPAGADCVVMLEHIESIPAEAGDSIRLASGRDVAAGSNIVPAGAEARAGSIVLGQGTRMAPRHIAAAASCGAVRLTVYGRPRVAILATGDELVEAGEQPLLHQIRNSNSYSLAVQVIARGADPVRLPIARDERSHLEQLMGSALDCDLLLLSGGVSMGKYDFVEEVLAGFGAEFHFSGALIQPGKPVVFGQMPRAHGGTLLPFFGLPGNPVSTMVTFALFVEPLLGVLSGQPWSGPSFAKASLAGDFATKQGLTRFLPAFLSTTSGLTPEVAPVGWQGSGDLAGTAHANCFLVVPPDRPTLAAGENVTVLLA